MTAELITDADRFFAEISERICSLSDAERFGIDLYELDGEKFSSGRHYRMMVRHSARAREWARTIEQRNYLEEVSRAQLIRFEDKLSRIVPKDSDDYEFTDRQLEIAIASLERNEQ